MTDYDDEIWDRKRGMYFDRQGTELSLREWAPLFEDFTYVDVRHDNVDDVRISTVWLGLNHNFRPGPPHIFETMVFNGPFHGDYWRHATEEEAIRCHEETVALMREAAASGRPSLTRAERLVLAQLDKEIADDA